MHGIFFRLKKYTTSQCAQYINLYSNQANLPTVTQQASNPRFHIYVLILCSGNTQCLSQDLETGCLKLAVVKFLGVHIFKGDHNILIFQP